MERMAEQGNGRAKRLVRLTQEPARFLATIQVAITLSGFLGSAFAADNFSEPLVDWVIGMGVNIPRSTLNKIEIPVTNPEIPIASSSDFFIAILFGTNSPKTNVKYDKINVINITALVSKVEQ